MTTGSTHRPASVYSAPPTTREAALELALVCRYYAEVYYAAETPWFYLRYWFGIPSTILASAAGATAFLKFAHSDLITGFVSVIVAILAAVYMALDPLAHAFEFHAAATEFEVLHHDAMFFADMEAHKDIDPTAMPRAGLRSLHERLTALKARRPASGAASYRKAERVLAGAVQGEVLVAARARFDAGAA